MMETTVLLRNSQAVSAEVEDEIIFLHEGEGTYFSLDEVGAFVWKTLESPQTFYELVQTVLGEYEVEETKLREDLTTLAVDLEAKGLLVINPE